MILYNLSRIVSALSFLSWRFSTEPRVDLIKKAGAGSVRVQRLLEGLVAEGFLKYCGETVVPGD
jgi:DNA-binding IclR family transcriptional regulator